jgi:hypothetical protein
MKSAMITEFVKFQALETTTEDQLLAKTDFLNDFQKEQDGYIDGELVKAVGANEWCIIYHYENMEKVKAIGEKMRGNKVFDGFMPLIVPGSLSVTFHQYLRKW